MNFDPYKQTFSAGKRPPLMKGIFDFLKNPHVLNRTVLLLVITYALFLLTWLYMYLFAMPLKFGETEFRFFVKYIALPGTVEGVKQMPWTIVTHFLAHTGFFNLLFHIIILVVFGKLFFQFWSGARFIFLLLLSAFAGAASFLYAPFIIPSLADVSQNSMLIGAGASVSALMIYMLVFMPDYTFVYMMLVRIKMKWIILAFVIITVLSYKSEMPGLLMSQLGGALFGGLFAFGSKFLQQKQRKQPKMRVKKSKKQEPVKTRTDEEYNIIKKQRQDKLDAILEKVSKTGYGSLTQEEKDFLFFESKR